MPPKSNDNWVFNLRHLFLMLSSNLSLISTFLQLYVLSQTTIYELRLQR